MAAPYTVTVRVPGGTQRQSANHGGSISPQISTYATSTIERDPDETIREGEEADFDVLEGTPMAGVDDDDIAHIVRTDENGNIGVFADSNNPISTQDLTDLSVSERQLKELKKINIHLSLLTDEIVEDQEIN